MLFSNYVFSSSIFWQSASKAATLALTSLTCAILIASSDSAASRTAVTSASFFFLGATFFVTI